MAQSSTQVRKSRKKLNLTQRLAEACAAIPAFDKLGRNDEYNYVYASQIFERFRHELLLRDIILLPDEKEVIEKDVPTVAGPTLRQVTLRVEYELRDCRSEDKITKCAFGVGMDGGDKAIYKAKTGALKYFFRVLGIIPWIERDDPEFDAAIDDQTDPKVYQKQAKNKRLTIKQIRAFDSACHRSGKTAIQIADLLRTKYDIATVTDLSQADFEEAIKLVSIAGTSVELTDVLEASRQIAEEKREKGTQPVARVLDEQPAELAGD